VIDAVGTTSRSRRLGAMRHTRTLVLLLTSLTLAACARGAGSPVTSASPGIDGRTFLSTSVDGKVLVAGTQIRVSFKKGQVSASAGCNSMGGAYRLDGNRLVTDQLATTDMGCQADLMAQDQWVAALLNGATLALDGNSLTMTGNGVRVTLLDRVVAYPDRPLLGTRWVVDGLLAGNVASSVPVGATAALTISEGRGDVETGCNTGGGTAAVAGSSITFGALTLTKKACLGDLAALEAAIVQAMKGTAAYSIEAGSMTLTSAGSGLSLHAAP
jgi:heat shock protein HslJ